MEAAKIYFIVFGALTIVGGIVGYIKAGSVASIIAGSITGVLLLVAAFLLPEHHTIGLATALVVSLLLAAQFVPKFLRTGRVMPAGMMSILSVIGIVAVIIAWVKKESRGKNSPSDVAAARDRHICHSFRRDCLPLDLARTAATDGANRATCHANTATHADAAAADHGKIGHGQAVQRDYTPRHG